MVKLKRNRTVVDRATEYLIRAALVGIALYALNRLALAPHFSGIRFFRAYWDDILALPVFIPLSFWLARKFSVLQPDKYLSWIHILLGWLVFSIVFEWLVPLLITHRYSDWGDVNAYALGGILLWWFSRWAIDFAHLRTTPIEVIYYDGTCGICQASMNWSSKRFKSVDTLDFHPYQNLDPNKNKELYSLAAKTVVAQLSDGTILSRNRAAGLVFLSLKTPWWWIGWLLTLQVLKPLTNPGYRLLARNRHRLSRWFGLTSCAIVS